MAMKRGKKIKVSKETSKVSPKLAKKKKKKPNKKFVSKMQLTANRAVVSKIY
jgi:hypothetical protein